MPPWVTQAHHHGHCASKGCPCCAGECLTCLAEWDFAETPAKAPYLTESPKPTPRAHASSARTRGASAPPTPPRDVDRANPHRGRADSAERRLAPPPVVLDDHARQVLADTYRGSGLGAAGRRPVSDASLITISSAPRSVVTAIRREKVGAVGSPAQGPQEGEHLDPADPRTVANRLGFLATDWHVIAKTHQPKLGAPGTVDGLGTHHEQMVDLARACGVFNVVIGQGRLGEDLFRGLKRIDPETLSTRRGSLARSPTAWRWPSRGSGGGDAAHAREAPTSTRRPSPSTTAPRTTSRRPRFISSGTFSHHSRTRRRPSLGKRLAMPSRGNGGSCALSPPGAWSMGASTSR